jgi:phage gpG-like protein
LKSDPPPDIITGAMYRAVTAKQTKRRNLQPPQTMLDLNATLELTGLEEAVTASIQRLTQQALTEAAAELRHRLLLQFESEGSAYGARWLPRKARDKNLPHRPLLFRTGRLKSSFTDRDSPDHVEELETEADRPILLFASRVLYASAHQWGTRRTPARPILTPEILTDL